MGEIRELFAARDHMGKIPMYIGYGSDGSAPWDPRGLRSANGGPREGGAPLPPLRGNVYVRHPTSGVDNLLHWPLLLLTDRQIGLCARVVRGREEARET